MNILPLVLVLMLMLSVMTVERLEKIKNQAIIQAEYQAFLRGSERQVFKLRQRRLFGESQISHRQLSFRFFLDEELREDKPSIAQQSRLIAIKLLEIVYGEATFFKSLKEKRPNFLNEMFEAIEGAASQAPEGMIKRIEDIARLDLEDEELQEAFYHMLKGTIAREQLKKVSMTSPRMQERAYPSLFTYINYNKDQKIVLQRAPQELLQAIFDDGEIVKAILAKRNELAANKDNGAQKAFESEFKGKLRPNLDDKLLDFSISASDKTNYD